MRLELPDSSDDIQLIKGWLLFEVAWNWMPYADKLIMIDDSESGMQAVEFTNKKLKENGIFDHFRLRGIVSVLFDPY